jgi:hypothetical protein
MISDPVEDILDFSQWLQKNSNVTSDHDHEYHYQFIHNYTTLFLSVDIL